jgi:hypothetical protein
LTLNIPGRKDLNCHQKTAGLRVSVNAIVERSRYAAEKAKSSVNSSKCSMPDTYNKKEYTMKSSEVKRFADLYERHLKLLKLQGKSTIDAYSRAVRRIRDH